MSLQMLQRVNLGEAVIEYEIVGSGEPVVLVHGSIVADSVAPLLGEPALTDRYRLVNFHRRGYAGSSRPDHVPSIEEQAADIRKLMHALDIDRAHVVGYSFGGVLALQLALDAPSAVHSLAILEPPLLFTPSAPAQLPSLMAALGSYQAGDRAGAVGTALTSMVGHDWRSILDRAIPSGYEQAVVDVDAFFALDFASLPAWRFTPEAAGRIRQPALAVLGADSSALNPSAQEAFEWLRQSLPRAEGYVLPGSTHALHMAKPREMADILAGFFDRHPLIES
jgi:pimeloyl-ACP methyl ester carboxylesterase